MNAPAVTAPMSGLSDQARTYVRSHPRQFRSERERQIALAAYRAGWFAGMIRQQEIRDMERLASQAGAS